VKLLAIAVVFLSMCIGLLAQPEGATVSGTVLDQVGKTIPNAAVTVKNDAGATIREVKTGDDGYFSAAGLPPGKYTIEVSASGFATARRTGVETAGGAGQNLSIPMSVASVNQSVTVEAVASLAAQLAPSGNVLDAISAKTEIGEHFIKNFTSPVSDFNEVIQTAPGTFSVNPNGVGLGQGKTFFRGFKDQQYSMTYDGIPFQDTNDPTHHSWAFFPAQWIGGVDFDRSPGMASTPGPTNFGGSINLLSPEPQSSPNVRGTGSYGSFNTRLLDLSLDSGQFDPDKKSSLFIDVHQMLSDGYETFNRQKRVAGAMKYQYRLTDKTTLSAYLGIIDLWTNTPDSNAPTRGDIAKFGDNYLLNNDPTSPNYFGYSFYHVQTDFVYIGINTELGRGWRLADKVNSYRYWNKQNLEKNLSAVSSTSAIDKLNGGNHFGDTLTLSQESKWGIFRTGIWYDWNYTDRYQYVSSPFNWADVASPNFHEHFITQIIHPFAEYEWRVTPKLVITAGVKDARYKMHLNQFQDIKTVGCLGGKKVGNACVGGAAFVTHDVDYNKWLPTAAARYRVQRNVSVYAQFGEGSQIPFSSVFDVPNGAVLKAPPETLAKTYQGGTVLKFNRWTLDLDAYYIHFQNQYVPVNDPANFNEPVYVLTGPNNTKGVEAESNIAIGHGVSLYLNGTLGSAKYQQTGLWVANAPHDTETVALTWQQKNWDVGFLDKRVGSMYNDNGSVNQAVPIDPFSVTNIFVNYTIRNASFLRGSKLGLAVNNLFDNHNITQVTPGVGPTAAVPYAPSAGDFLQLLPGRSVMVSLTIGYAPKR
jgi:iron complex outermembrane receptor protein